MKSLIHTVATLAIISALFVTGCKQSMVISKVDYSQSIESVLTPNDEGVVEDVQHGLKFNIKPLQYAETQDTSSITTNEVRYIRGQEGYYYITAPNYKNVYVMTPEEGELKLKNKLTISESGLEEPAFNQRTSYIQLLNQKSEESWQIKPDDVQKEESQLTKREDD
jgi:hypothetical protein